MKSWFYDLQEIPLTLWQRNDSLGRRGEQLACRYLRQKGYQIVAQRFRTKFGEIDIIARKQNLLAFVEVKTRRGSRFGTPLMAITRDKQIKLLKAAQIYLKGLGKIAQNYRTQFLGIGIEFDHRTHRLECVRLGE